MKAFSSDSVYEAREGAGERPRVRERVAVLVAVQAGRRRNTREKDRASEI